MIYDELSHTYYLAMIGFLVYFVAFFEMKNALFHSNDIEYKLSNRNLFMTTLLIRLKFGYELQIQVRFRLFGHRNQVKGFLY